MKCPAVGRVKWDNTTFEDGDALDIPMDGVISVRCCDCGLVHTMQLVPGGTTDKLYVWRDNRRTGAVRAWMRRRDYWPGDTLLMLRALLGRKP